MNFEYLFKKSPMNRVIQAGLDAISGNSEKSSNNVDKQEVRDESSLEYGARILASSMRGHEPENYWPSTAEVDHLISNKNAELIFDQDPQGRKTVSFIAPPAAKTEVAISQSFYNMFVGKYGEDHNFKVKDLMEFITENPHLARTDLAIPSSPEQQDNKSQQASAVDNKAIQALCSQEFNNLYQQAQGQSLSQGLGR